jgi:hypothetical protein
MIVNLKQILLILDQHDSLARIAKQEGTGISEIVRTAELPVVAFGGAQDAI